MPRADTVAGVARAWRFAVPAFGRASQEITLQGKSLAIVGVPICPQHYRQAEWEEEAREPGVSVVRIGLAIRPHTNLKLAMRTLCGVSLHALGRRYQRGRPITDDAVIAGIHALAAAHERLAALPEDTRCALDVPGGRWLGTVLDTRAHASGRTERVPGARTFVEA